MQNKTDSLFITNPHAGHKLVSTMLPEYLKNELIEASKISDEKLRLKTITKVERKAKTLHKELFRIDLSPVQDLEWVLSATRVR